MESCCCSVLQAPIPLTQKEPVFRAKGKLEPPAAIEYGSFDRRNTMWNVTSRSNLVNNNEEYQLMQFHLHQPSEHTIETKVMDLELHFVFRGNASTLVFAVMATLSSFTSPLLQALLQGRHLELTPPAHYWSYSGSLTTPPFTTTVQWLVQHEALTITRHDLSRLARFSKSSRPTQARDGRDVVFVQNK